MKMNEDRVPSTLDEALDMLESAVDPKEIEFIKASDPEDLAGQVHFQFGMYLRNNWSLWEKDTPLVNWFKNIGITHADDMSSIINVSFCRRVRDEELRLAEQVEIYQKHWIKHLGRPIP